MKKVLPFVMSFILLVTPCMATASNDITVSLDGSLIDFTHAPVIVSDRTMVHLRSFADIFEYDIAWNERNKTVILNDTKTYVTVEIDNPEILVVSDGKSRKEESEIPPMIIDDSTYLPLRCVASLFDTEVQWNEELRCVELVSKKEEIKAPTFYFQNQDLWELENYGSSYCWVTCYAMVLNNLIGDVTPPDIAKVNLENCESGAYCYHYQIAEAFGVRFTEAIDEDSEYFDYLHDGYATYIKNEEKDEEIAINAIKEALDKHPEGIMVRFEESPHTIVATYYDDENIYFNEPMPTKQGEYDDESPYQNVTFDKTYPALMGYSIADFTFLQAIDEN